MFSRLWARASPQRGISLKNPGAFPLFISAPTPALSYGILFQIPYSSSWPCSLLFMIVLMLCKRETVLPSRTKASSCEGTSYIPQNVLPFCQRRVPCLPLLLCLPDRRSRYPLHSNTFPLLNDFICLITLNDRARPTTSRF